jgi:hypothetical protein
MLGTSWDAPVRLYQARRRTPGKAPSRRFTLDILLVAWRKKSLQPLDVGEIGRLLHNKALRGQARSAVADEGPPEALTVRADLSTGVGAASCGERSIG